MYNMTIDQFDVAHSRVMRMWDRIDRQQTVMLARQARETVTWAEVQAFVSRIDRATARLKKVHDALRARAAS